MKTMSRSHVGLVATSALVAVMATAQDMPLLHLGRLPDALVQVCEEERPFLAPAGGEAVIFSPSDGRIWLARPQPLEEPRIEATAAMVRPFAVTYEPYSRDPLTTITVTNNKAPVPPPAPGPQPAPPSEGNGRRAEDPMEHPHV